MKFFYKQVMNIHHHHHYNFSFITALRNFKSVKTFTREQNAYYPFSYLRLHIKTQLGKHPYKSILFT